MTHGLTDERQHALRTAALEHAERFDGLDREELERWQLQRLNETLAHCYEHSPHYRARRLQEAMPDQLASLDALSALPFTTKTNLRDCYPFDLLATSRTQLSRYGESTGTTGPPTSAFITYEDWIAGNVWVERAFARFFGPGDVVFIAIPYELTFASYDIDRALEQCGAAIVAAGTLNQVCPFERMVTMMRTIRPTGLVCTPTRALRLYDMLCEQGHDPLDVGLQTFLYVGETCSQAKLDKIAELWQVRLISAYGSTETNSLALPCAEGVAHLTEDRHAFEVVDPLLGVPLGCDRTGELVLTSLRTKAMPLLRYRTGDLVVIESKPCRCRSARRVLRHLGRVSERLSIQGETVDKLALEQVILSMPGTGLYYAAGVRDGALTVYVEVTGDGNAVTCSEIEERVRATFELPCRVEPVDKRIVMAAMDRMLKPGGLRLEELEAVA
jgi:phenylacetate-CoA ligase